MAGERDGEYGYPAGHEKDTRQYGPFRPSLPSIPPNRLASAYLSIYNSHTQHTPAPAGRVSGLPVHKRKRDEDLEAAADTKTHDKSILTGETTSAARQLYGCYFNISDSYTDALVGDYAASDPIYPKEYSEESP